MRRKFVIGCVLLLLALVCPVIAGESEDEHQYSRSGPVPPPGVLPKISMQGQTRADGDASIILSVSGYAWRHGCGPTAVGMVVGYYDGLGYEDLIPGDAGTQTSDVDQVIASQGDAQNPKHYEDYSLPMDSGEPNVIPDKSELPIGDEHAHDCIADFMKTSWSYTGRPYGSSSSADIASAFTDYVNLINPDYGPSSQFYYKISDKLTWDILTQEINAARPMVFLVDTDGNGQTDHFVTIVGYRDDGVQQYCCLDTWYPYDVVRWCAFATMQDGQPWGIYGGWTFRLAPEEDIVNMEDFAVLSSGWATTFDAYDLDIMALHWLTEGSDQIEWVFINNDPGVSGHEPFHGYMSKYETTNAQFCQFLNAALASGDIAFDIAEPNIVVGANGSNSGADFASEPYYNLDGPGVTRYGVTDGGAARINYTGGSFTVDSGFEKHPVNYVSWYGATAFCNYYGYRLPTEWQWQAVADFDGTYIYGCGPSINNTIANYRYSAHPDGTTPVGYFGAYGYGVCDMSGNLWEWTSTVSGSSRRIRDGCCWWNVANTISLSSQYSPHYITNFVGFRVCR